MVVKLTREARIRKELIADAGKKVIERTPATIDSLQCMKEPYSLDKDDDIKKLFYITNDLSAFSNALKTFKVIYESENEKMKRITFQNRLQVEESMNLVSTLLLESCEASPNFKDNLDYIKSLNDFNVRYFIDNIYRKAVNKKQSISDAAHNVIGIKDEAFRATEELTKLYDYSEKEDNDKLKSYFSTLVTFFEAIDDFDDTYEGKPKTTQVSFLNLWNVVEAAKLDILEKIDNIYEPHNGGKNFILNLRYGLSVNPNLKNYFSAK